MHCKSSCVLIFGASVKEIELCQHVCDARHRRTALAACILVLGFGAKARSTVGSPWELAWTGAVRAVNEGARYAGLHLSARAKGSPGPPVWTALGGALPPKRGPGLCLCQDAERPHPEGVCMQNSMGTACAYRGCKAAVGSHQRGLIGHPAAQWRCGGVLVALSRPTGTPSGEGGSACPAGRAYRLGACATPRRPRRRCGGPPQRTRRRPCAQQCWRAPARGGG